MLDGGEGDWLKLTNNKIKWEAFIEWIELKG